MKRSIQISSILAATLLAGSMVMTTAAAGGMGMGSSNQGPQRGYGPGGGYGYGPGNDFGPGYGRGGRGYGPRDGSGPGFGPGPGGSYFLGDYDKELKGGLLRTITKE